MPDLPGPRHASPCTGSVALRGGPQERAPDSPKGAPVVEREGKRRRLATLVGVWLLGSGAALALHAPPAPRDRGVGPDVELAHVRREQALLRAESTVRLLRSLDARERPTGVRR
jgi:hypothetical protein